MHRVGILKVTKFPYFVMEKSWNFKVQKEHKLFFCFSIFIALYLGLVGGGGKTYRDNHQSLPQPTIDTCLQDVHANN